MTWHANEAREIRPRDTRRMEVLSSRIIIHAADLGRSRRFYEETLGLRIYREYGAQGAVTGVVYFLGGGFLEDPGRRPDGGRRLRPLLGDRRPGARAEATPVATREAQSGRMF